jgi:gas vesicle protein
MAQTHEKGTKEKRDKKLTKRGGMNMWRKEAAHNQERPLLSEEDELRCRIANVRDYVNTFGMSGLWDKKPSDAGDFSRYLDNAAKEALLAVAAVAAFKRAVLSVPGLSDESRQELAEKVKALEEEALKVQKSINALRGATNAGRIGSSGAAEAWPVTLDEMRAAVGSLSDKQEEAWQTLVDGVKQTTKEG